jgi:putative ABC transport system substrate-binding protein
MTCNRREVLALGAAALLGAPVSRAQPSPKRVVWLGGYVSAERAHARIRNVFASRGLVEGRDFVMTLEPIRDTSKESAEAQIDELVNRRPDVIVMLANWTLALLQKRTRQIPIVFYNISSDPVTLGLVESLRRPGANITGTTIMGDQMITKIWQLLKEVRPSMKIGADCLVKEEAALEMALESIDALAAERRIWREINRHVEARLGITIREVGISRAATGKEISAAVKKSRAEALVVDEPPDALIEFLKTSRIPACGWFFRNVKRGMLLGVSFEWDEGETQAALMAARILRGESPATIPVYRTDRHAVGVNLRTARAMGIEIPHPILLQAELVVE